MVKLILSWTHEIELSRSNEIKARFIFCETTTNMRHQGSKKTMEKRLDSEDYNFNYFQGKISQQGIT